MTVLWRTSKSCLQNKKIQKPARSKGAGTRNKKGATSFLTPAPFLLVEQLLFNHNMQIFIALKILQ